MMISPIDLVVPPTTTCEALGANEMGVPDTVIPGPPGVSVCVPMTKFPWELAVITCPLIVIADADDPAGREIGVPATVIAAPPGVKV
jgi:hypothetical protein